MHLLNILQSIPRFALCSCISVQVAPLGSNNKVKLDATFLDKALLDIVKYELGFYFGAAIDILKKISTDAFELILKQLSDKTTDVDQMRRIAEM